MTTILDKPLPPSDVLAALDEQAAGDAAWNDPGILTGLYVPETDVLDLATRAYQKYLTPNALHINLFPSIGQMERDIVTALAKLLRGGKKIAGNVTSGGTESIMLAVKTARDHARAMRPDITEPEIVLPITAHPAFHKAAHYLGLSVTVTPVDPAEFRADLAAYQDALGPNTVLAVGSAPNYSHGTIDPIPEMARLAQESGIPFHVDGCVGALYLSYLRRLGSDLPDFDFSVPGVSSLSVDLHKYGYAPKNTSVVLYADRDYRRHAWFVSTGTTEYAVINPTVQSSRSGGPVAAAWAVMHHLGHAGYEKMIAKTQKAAETLRAEIDRIDGVRVLANPAMCMFAIVSDDVNIFEVDDMMRDRGWALTPQFACAGGPENLHVSLHYGGLANLDRFAPDLQAVVLELKQTGSSIDLKAMRAAVAEHMDKPVPQMLLHLAPLAGLAGSDLPQALAPLNSLLNLLPAPIRDEALTLYLNQTQ